MIRIAAATNINQWSAHNYFDELKMRSSVMLGLMGDSGKLLGFIIGRIVGGASAGTRDAEIYNIAVVPSHQGKGLGQTLFTDFLERCCKAEAENIWLEVRESNLTAIAFYRKNRFREVQKRVNFYEHPRENALLMRRKLKG